MTILALMKNICQVIRNPSIFDSIFDVSISKQDSMKVLLKRTQFYLSRINIYGVNYMPHPLRAKYIKENDLTRKLFEKQMLLDLVDREVREYYDKINKDLHVDLLHCEYPILYDYIRKNSSCPDDELKAVFSLREKKDIKELRKSFDLLDHEYNSGNVEMVKMAIQMIKESSQEITNKYNKNKTLKLGELRLGLTPTLNIPINIPLPIRFRKKKKTFKPYIFNTFNGFRYS